MGTPLRLLLLEDSTQDAERIVDELHRGGYDPAVRRVETVEELAAALREAQWDVVIADYLLARANALAGLRLLQEGGLDLPFIVVSGSAGEDFADEAMKAGADDYLTKDSLTRLVPAVRRELCDAINRRVHGQAADQLRQTETRLRAVVANAPVAIFAMDARGTVLLHEGRSACFAGDRGSGANGDGLVGLDFFQLRSDQPGMLGNLRRALAGEELTDVHEAPGGRVFEVRYSPLRAGAGAVGGAGDISGVIGVGTDVTERIQLIHAQKLEAIGRLAGGVAHDLNNMMLVVAGYADRALRELPPGHPLRAHLEEIGRAGARAAGLTRQLLAFSRKQILRPEPLDLNAVINELARMLRRVLQENVTLELKLSPEIGLVQADRAQMEQAVVNLAVNARDAMPDGGTLTIATARLDLDEHQAREHPGARTGPHVVLTVSDSGCGMDAATCARIFEPFFTTKQPGEGTGLGLSMVYGFVSQSGGHVTVESEPGQGATFRICLPQSAAPAPAAEEPRPLDAPACRLPRGGEIVLLVEDEDMVRELVALELTDVGFVVLKACNGSQALSLADSHAGPIDLLLTDVVMPGLSGPRIHQALQARRPGMKVLYMSGHSGKHIAHHGVLAPGTHFIEKPFKPEQLQAKVREAIDTPPPPVEPVQNEGVAAE